MQNLLAKYGKITPLRADEEQTFRDLVSTKRNLANGAQLISAEFDEPDQLYIVEDGRLFASNELPGGERAITRLYFSGDIIGTANIPFDTATHTVTACAPSTVYVFPRAKLVDAFVRMPRVAAIFYTFAAMENAILNDRLVSIGRTRGKARLAALICEIEARRNLLADKALDTFRIGLTQAQIGDAIGLTEVQVNRLLKELDEEGAISRIGGTITVREHSTLCEIGQFKDRYEDLDLDWFEDELPG